MQRSEGCGKLDVNGKPTPPCDRCDHCAFNKLMAAVISMYPYVQTHEATVPAYWSQLRRFELDVVRQACKRAIKASPDFMPTEPQVEACCEVIVKEAAGRKPSQRVLLTGDVMPTCTLDPDHPAMTLARELEEESRRFGYDDENPAPREINHRRMERIHALFGRDFQRVAKEMP